ncbi:MAG: hypothetical protein WCV50_04065 [Patescibacteria group bacterium]|jgi:hypothetical protein
MSGKNVLTALSNLPELILAIIQKPDLIMEIIGRWRELFKVPSKQKRQLGDLLLDEHPAITRLVLRQVMAGSLDLSKFVTDLPETYQEDANLRITAVLLFLYATNDSLLNRTDKGFPTVEWLDLKAPEPTPVVRGKKKTGKKGKKTPKGADNAKPGKPVPASKLKGVKKFADLLAKCGSLANLLATFEAHSGKDGKLTPFLHVCEISNSTWYQWAKKAHAMEAEAEKGGGKPDKGSPEGEKAVRGRLGEFITQHKTAAEALKVLQSKPEDKTVHEYAESLGISDASYYAWPAKLVELAEKESKKPDGGPGNADDGTDVTSKVVAKLGNKANAKEMIKEAGSMLQLAINLGVAGLTTSNLGYILLHKYGLRLSKVLAEPDGADAPDGGNPPDTGKKGSADTTSPIMAGLSILTSADMSDDQRQKFCEFASALGASTASEVFEIVEKGVKDDFPKAAAKFVEAGILTASSAGEPPVEQKYFKWKFKLVH